MDDYNEYDHDDGKPFELCNWCGYHMPFEHEVSLFPGTPLPVCPRCKHGGTEIPPAFVNFCECGHSFEEHGKIRVQGREVLLAELICTKCSCDFFLTDTNQLSQRQRWLLSTGR